MQNRNREALSIFSNSITFYKKMNSRFSLEKVDDSFDDKKNKGSSEEDTFRSYQVALQCCINFLLENGFSPLMLKETVSVDRKTRADFINQFGSLLFNAIYFNRQLELKQAKSAYVGAEEEGISQLGRQIDRSKLRMKCVKSRVVPFAGIPPIFLSCLFAALYLVDRYVPNRDRYVNATSDDVRQAKTLAEVSAVMCVIGVAFTAALYFGCLYKTRQTEAKFCREEDVRQANLDAFNAAFNEISILDRLSEDQTMHERQFNRLICGELLLEDAMNGVNFVEDAKLPAADVEAPQAREMDEYSSLIANRRQ